MQRWPILDSRLEFYQYVITVANLLAIQDSIIVFRRACSRLVSIVFSYTAV